MSGKKIELSEIEGQLLAIQAMRRDGYNYQQIADYLNDRAVPRISEQENGGEYEVALWSRQAVRHLSQRRGHEVDPGTRSAEDHLLCFMKLGAQSEIWPSDWVDEPVAGFPEIDYTDGGFNWTKGELETATMTAEIFIEEITGSQDQMVLDFRIDQLET